jgi:dTDP-4-amino-4,6-dideoxygalactose transaminase
MNELAGAVAMAQLEKLDGSVSQRVAMAELFTQKLEGTPGIGLPPIADDAVATFWKYSVDVDPDVIEGGTVALGAALKERGIFCAPRYIQKPAFQCAVIKDQRTFGNSRFPFTMALPDAVDYSPEKFPGTFEALARVLVLPWNEKYSVEDVEYIATNIREAAASLAKA